MINSLALAAGISPDTIWNRQHIYKACMVEEMMRGCGSAGKFRSATVAESEEYRADFYQNLGWYWFGVGAIALERLEVEHRAKMGAAVPPPN
jgi:hypothetical protein